jgi:hypothetical protein
MPESKQPHLNGAYYGPSIPPPSKSYHRPGRGGGGGGFFSCCCGCICSCIFNLIFQIVLTIVIILGVIALIFYLLFRPNNVKFHVTDVSLTRFEHTNDTLFYNMNANLTIRNPNRRIGIYYDTIEARGEYQGHRFGSQDITRFYQGHKTTNNVSVDLQGQNIVMLEGDQLNRYNSERSSGMYRIDLKLRLRIRLRLGIVKTPRFRPKIECDLRVPLNSNGSSSGGTFETTRCDFDWH